MYADAGLLTYRKETYHAAVRLELVEGQANDAFAYILEKLHLVILSWV